MTHSTPQQLHALVTGTLSESAVDALEAHLTHCDECSARLAACAQQELALYELAEAASDPAQQPAPSRGWVVGVALAAAAALAVVAWQTTVTLNAAPPPTAAMVMVSHCAAQADMPCTEEAAQQGLMLGGTVPRYESFRPGMPRYDPPVRP